MILAGILALEVAITLWDFVEALVAAHHHATVLTCDPRKVDKLAHPVRAMRSLNVVQNDERFDAIGNLAKKGIADGLGAAKKRARIIASRVEITRDLDALVARLDQKPDCLINGSAVGWYGLQGKTKLAEDAAPAPAFVHDVCAQWETAAQGISRHGVRVVLLRIGLVLGVDGGMLGKLLMPFEFGGGGIIGSGRQWMSWIEHDDLVRVIALAIASPGIEGPVNAVATAPRQTKSSPESWLRPCIVPHF